MTKKLCRTLILQLSTNYKFLDDWLELILELSESRWRQKWTIVDFIKEIEENWLMKKIQTLQVIM